MKCFASFFIMLFPMIPVAADSAVKEIVIFKVKDGSKGIEIARAIVNDIKKFNGGVNDDKLYQSVNDPSVIAQCITWESLEKAQEAASAFQSFPSSKSFFEESGEIIFFDHFVEISQ